MNMSGAHRDATGGDGLAGGELRSVREEAFEDCGAEAHPDAALGKVLVLGVELVQVRVGLPFLEQQLDLPPETVEPRDEVEGERRTRQLGTQTRHRLLVAGQHDDAKLDHALATFVLEIHAPVGMLGNEARQADRLE
jgi:hypothetical protein